MPSAHLLAIPSAPTTVLIVLFNYV